MQALQAISNGSFVVDVDGIEQTVASLDFRTAVDFDDVATLINTEIAGADFVHENGRFILTSSSTGVASVLATSLKKVRVSSSATFLVCLTVPGAFLRQGFDEETLPAETKLEALSVLKSEVNYKGVCFIDLVLDNEVPAIAAWAGANSVIFLQRLHWCQLSDHWNHQPSVAGASVWSK